MPETTPAPDRFSLTLPSGGERTVFMSFGLLNTITGFFSRVDELPLLFTDPQLRATIVGECLADRDNTGKIVSLPNPFEIELSAAQVIGLLQWVEAHVNGFFTSTLTAAVQTMKRQSR